MTLALTEEQLILRETARSWLEENSPVSRMRALRDEKDAVGFSRSLWREMAEMGWVGIPFPEEVGGAALGMAELGIVLEECGRVLAPEPFLSTVLLGGNAILLGAAEPLQKELLPDVCGGQRILALAAEEQGRFDPWAVTTEAARDGDGYRISGKKQYVLDAHVADQLIVVGRTAGAPGERDGLSLFVVDAGASGVSIQRSEMVDGRNAGIVTSMASTRLRMTECLARSTRVQPCSTPSSIAQRSGSPPSSSARPMRPSNARSPTSKRASSSASRSARSRRFGTALRTCSANSSSRVRSSATRSPPSTRDATNSRRWRARPRHGSRMSRP